MARTSPWRCRPARTTIRISTDAWTATHEPGHEARGGRLGTHGRGLRTTGPDAGRGHGQTYDDRGRHHPHDDVRQPAARLSARGPRCPITGRPAARGRREAR